MHIVNQLQVHVDRIKHALESIDRDSFLGALPFVMIEDNEVHKSLPVCTSAVYFLTHPSLGLLYIGKSKLLKTRWYSNAYNEHACLEIALRTENVRLVWWAIPEELITI